MDMQNVIYAVAVLFIMGIVFAILLGVAAKVFAVEVDERIPLVRECLPGANCGGCGFPGCDGLAAAIVEGRAPVNGCPVGGAAAAEKVAKVLGVEVAAGDRQVAHVYCNGGCNAKDKANYEGLQDCNAAMRVASGPKACSFGCMGLGSCVKACAFDAIHIVDGVAKVDTDKCVACGKCVSTCPKKIINLVSEVKKVHVNCVNKDKGPEEMTVPIAINHVDCFPVVFRKFPAPQRQLLAEFEIHISVIITAGIENIHEVNITGIRIVQHASPRRIELGKKPLGESNIIIPGNSKRKFVQCEIPR